MTLSAAFLEVGTKLADFFETCADIVLRPG
jgi:hypothetical protein